LLKSHLKHLLGCLMLELAALCGVKVNRPRRRRSRKWKRRKAAILRWATLAGLAVCAVMFLAGAVKLVGYGVERLSAAMSSRQLRQMYYEAETAAPTETPEPISSTAPQVVVRFATDTPSAVPIPSPAPQGTAAPVTLRSFDYPNNPTHIINSRFKTIRQQNADIVGWLTINGLLDEAVVQRDNIYYMTHDYLCRENANGAIFLDQIIGLDKRPYTLILYGHNMKSGAMFGNLRKYEKFFYYYQHRVFQFDTLYEEGQYVIFAVETVSVCPVEMALMGSSVTSRVPSARSEEAGLSKITYRRL